MTFRDYLGLLRRRVGLVVVIVAISVGVTVGIALASTPQYGGTVRLHLLPQAPLNSALQTQLNGSSGGGVDLLTEAELVKSEAVAQNVIASLGFKVAPSDLVKNLSVAALPGTTIIVIDCGASSPADANNLANA